jgi:hypothetical protein
MAEVETSVAQVGLRDFLFYVIPGTVILAGILAFEGVDGKDLQAYSGFSSSIAGILLSYALGQCAYPLAYLVRAFGNLFGRLRYVEGEENSHFRSTYRLMAANNPTYFAVEIFRYRTMARFCSLMVSPVVFVAGAILFGQWHLNTREKICLAGTALLASAGFVQRYCRYERRYRASLHDDLAKDGRNEW